jgi:transposase InsO family protein
MNEQEVNRRLKIIEFSKTHGYQATLDAFKVSERTIQRWKRLLKDNQGKLNYLSPKSKRPRNVRERKIDQIIIQEIIHLRKTRHKLGKDKIVPLLRKKFSNLIIPKVSTVARILIDLKKRGLIPNNQKLSLYARTGKLHLKTKRTRKKLRKSTGEHVFEVDTIIRHFNGIKLYTVTGIDIKTRIAFAKSYFNHSSNSTRDFILECIKQISILKIQTDNGSEFEKYFEQTLKANNITQYFTYPRCPKMNAHIERFNRTIDEEFIRWNKYRAVLSLDDFNQKQTEWLNWYNEERPHASLNFLSPKEYVLQLEKSDICM